jgi:hypothetical protein
MRKSNISFQIWGHVKLGCYEIWLRTSTQPLISYLVSKCKLKHQIIT